MKRLLVIFLLLSGCIGINFGVRKELAAIAVSEEDLGADWALASENISGSVYAVAFARLEHASGKFERLVNRVSLYPDAQTALSAYQGNAKTLEMSLSVSTPKVGEHSLLLTRGGFSYLVFVRGKAMVELEYTTSMPSDTGFLVGLAEKVDSRIK